MSPDGPLEWSDPVETIERPGWTEYLIRQWAWLLRLMEPVREDALGKIGFEKALAVIDQIPQPGTVEQANARFRTAVVVCWQTWESWRVRAKGPRRLVG